VIMGVMGGGVVTPLSVVRPFGMRVLLRGLGYVWKSVLNHWLPN
jgi:hypothetical protein